MRYIDPKSVEEHLPQGWSVRAQAAARAVEASDPQKRSAEVNSHQDVWKDLKETLKDASHKKCWYCESIDSRSDNAVDHFRPKNSVCECSGSNGYWWLAFDWKNYRYSCTFCNSRRKDQENDHLGGKADHFPLKDEPKRAKCPKDDIRDEEPMLLDPMVPADPGMLWFDEDGKARPNPRFCNDPNGYPTRRVVTSIDLYHLNHTDLVERRKVLCREIRQQVENIDRYFDKYDNGDGTARQAFEDMIGSLRGSIVPSSEYSATARSILEGLKQDHPVLEMVLMTA